MAKPARSSAAPDNAFIRDFYDTVPTEDKALIPAADQNAIATLHYAMAAERRAGKPSIKIHVPPIDNKKWDSGRTVVDIVNDDMAFLVDSVAAEIARHGRTIRLLIHPIIGKTSHIHVEIQGAMSDPQTAQLKSDLARVLDDVRHATEDWRLIRDKLRDCQKPLSRAPKTYPAEEVEELLYFLDYLYKDNFTLLGCREFAFKNGKTSPVKGSGLGLLRDSISPPYINESGSDGLPTSLILSDEELPAVVVTKIGKRSTVHRPVPMDAIAVRQFDDKGNVTGFSLFIGLFTSVTYSRSITDIPYLRRKAEEVLRLSGTKPGSHDYKTLRHILEKYPRDELFQIKLSRLVKTALGLVTLQERQRIAVYNRKDPFDRFISCLVYVPRERYDSRLRQNFQKILEQELQGTCGNFYTTLDDSPLARVMYIINYDGRKPPEYKTTAIEARLQEAGRVWSEKLGEALLVKKTNEQEVASLVQNFGHAFPAGYQETYLAKQAVHDIIKISEAQKGPRFALDLYHDHTCSERQLRLKIFHKGAPVTLSDALPILENMGLRTISEMPFCVKPQNGESVWIHDFLMEIKNPSFPAFTKECTETKARFEEDFARIWYGEAENDTLNQLVLGASLDWREIVVLRSYVRYLRQTANPFGKMYIEMALTKHPDIAHLVIDLFKAYFDTAGKNADTKAKSINAAIEKALEKVESLDEDRILRSIVGLVNATLRTNFYQKDENGQPKVWLSLKFDSKKIGDLPEPKPFREIFVYAPRVEAVHLRSDWISRGGIRWSDRHEDFRTEVLGLMKTQQVKNSVIVPMGAKGGFIVKRPPKEGGRAAYQQEGVECYKIFIRGLLDITDNRKGKRVVPPKDVVRRDADDPYLVVAADKGTATFSDTANALSLEYGHWLGDAFASGGSAGYDHKKMGITARGAWESVKRHFRELGKDIQNEDFIVTGVGDMGGDVFGNGMLLSPHIRLIAAFNHVHIFVDPTPDAASSFKERERLFREVKGWDSYDAKKLSKGGRIYNRSDKSLSLTPEIKKLLGLTQDTIAPPDLIQAILKCETELLWVGGIGTYIKATAETHADVGDKGNDSLRVSASELKAKVIGEGANLALTQKARVELGLRGVKLNADFIDNSGGVDSSDHEVNIKILMADVMADPAHKMDTTKRNKLLASMTEEVAGLVLAHNYQQSQGISLMELQAPDTLSADMKFIRGLERTQGLNRKLEGLPDDETAIARQAANKGLTRPELSTLQAYAKIAFCRELMASDLPDLPELEPWLIRYFPGPLQKNFHAEILSHRLKREIIATALSFTLVNRMGPTFVNAMMDKTGCSAAEVAKAWLIVTEAFNLPALWKEIESLDGKVPGTAQLQALREVAKMAERETQWFLTKLGKAPDIKRDVASFRASIETLGKNLDSVVTKNRAEETATRTVKFHKDGLPEDLAHRIALVPLLGASCDIIRISLDRKVDLLLAAKVYFELGESFHLNWLREEARKLKKADRAATEALDSIIDHIYSCQSGLTLRILKDMDKTLKGIKGGVFKLWIAAPEGAHAVPVERFLADIHRTGAVTLATLVIAEQRMRGLFSG